MPFSPQQSPSLWCNIFTLLYTLKSNYGAPPLPQAQAGRNGWVRNF
jgi:hypothetical protein